MPIKLLLCKKKICLVFLFPCIKTIYVAHHTMLADWISRAWTLAAGSNKYSNQSNKNLVLPNVSVPYTELIFGYGNSVWFVELYSCK